MFNPVFPFTPQVLQKTVERGCHYFVRNYWSPATDHFEEGINGYFIITHYDDKAKAMAHFNSVTGDKYRHFYNWNVQEDKERLKIAATQPKGYRIFSAYFLDDYQKRITNRLKEKINNYMYRHTSWKPKKGETVSIDFYLQFGSLYITMSYAGSQIRVKFDDIEKTI